MKKFVLLSFFCGCISVSAGELDARVFESGFYVGMGAEGTYDKNEWWLNAYSNGATEYQRVDFKKNNWFYNPQLFCGYMNHEPFFYAFEVDLSLNSKKIDHTFPKLGGAHPLKADSVLKIQNGNDLSFRIKAGKTFSCYTAYFIGGIHCRKLKFSFDYLPNRDDDDEDAALLKSGSEKSKTVVRPEFGIGVSYGANNTEFSLEYVYKLKGAIRLSSSVDTDWVDESAEYPREFRCENGQHSVSIRVSKSIKW